MEDISCCVWQSLSVLEQFFGALDQCSSWDGYVRLPQQYEGRWGWGKTNDQMNSVRNSWKVGAAGTNERPMYEKASRRYYKVLSRCCLHKSPCPSIFPVSPTHIYHICDVHHNCSCNLLIFLMLCPYWYTHTERCKYLHVYTFLSIRFLPEAIKRSNSLPIWAAEIDKYHAVAASREAEVCHPGRGETRLSVTGGMGQVGLSLEKDRFFTVTNITNWHDKQLTWWFRSPNLLKK